MKKVLVRLIPALFVLTLVIGFIYNLFYHGQIEHPGKSVYANQCAQCHGDEGEGIKVLVPPMARADIFLQNFDSIPCWLKHGLNHPIVVNGQAYDQPMYPPGVDEIQIANVMNYISKQFMNSDREINSIWVKEKLKGCK
jgi:mono/diheme cytochrome c family protein